MTGAKWTLASIDENWIAVHQATLVFVEHQGQVLLIRKKRGLGAGKINGPGGKLDAGETPLQCAVREVQEELCITPTRLENAGELRFQFIDDYAIHVHVFVASGFVGTPTETDEAIPLWFTPDSIPYEQMWADDEIWLPNVLGGQWVTGRFIFDNDQLLAHDVQYRLR